MPIISSQLVRTGANDPMYIPVGSAAVVGSLDVLGSAEVQASMTVGKVQPAQATLDVDGAGYFVAPGGDSQNGGLRVYGEATQRMDIGYSDLPGFVGPSMQATTGLTPSDLMINPQGGAVSMGGALGVAGNITSTGAISANNAPYYTIMNPGGNFVGNNNLDLMGIGSSISFANAVTHFDVTGAASFINGRGAGDGLLGIGTKTPTQTLDVSGVIQSSTNIVCNGYVKANQLSAYSAGLFGSGDTVIAAATDAIVVPFPNMTAGGRIMLTYKQPGAGGAGDNGGGALTAWPALNSFTIYTQAAVSADTTVSWMVVSLG